jgi:hypothetical protein
MRPTSTRPARSKGLSRFTLNVRPDTLDFRDLMYQSTLVEVPTEIPLRDYLALRVPILDQGGEGSCTGHGLATVAHFLLRRRRVVPDRESVSPTMLYEMAKRYDEWPGTRYAGSSARGAMKGWHKHGVCALSQWGPGKRGAKPNVLTAERAADARRRPLGAYFRVNHRDLKAMHAALAEVGILFATADVHAGWDEVAGDGKIPFRDTIEGGHAFAIVAYDRDGLWIQNSWGEGWGRLGFGHLSYDDWLKNGDDAWVARLGAPVHLEIEDSRTAIRSALAGLGESLSYADLRPHVVSIGNDGALRTTGLHGTSPDQVRAVFEDDLPRITSRWKRKRLLLYAHGGLVQEQGALQRLSDYREALLANEIYPLSFVWKSDYWSTLTGALEDAIKQRRPEGLLDASKDFLLDRLDDTLEPIARAGTGKLEWNEMKENARLATEAEDGGARFTAEQIAKLLRKNRSIELHVIGHSAGSIFHAPLVQYLTARGRIMKGGMKGTSGLGLGIKTCTMWAPACTVEVFKDHYLPAIRAEAIERFALFTLTDRAEQDDDCANIYHKSLLYLVSRAFEAEPARPFVRASGEPVLGMELWVNEDPELTALFEPQGPRAQWIKSPNQAPEGSPDASTARHHGDFDHDPPTVWATVHRILGATPSDRTTITFRPSAQSRRARRLVLAQ